MRELYLISGILAPISYLLAVVVGGFLIEGYSHTYNSISELTASNVPKKPILFFLFALYNLSLSIFGIGMYVNLSSSSTKLPGIAAIMTIIVGLLGIAMLYFVQDPREIKMSFNGKMHIIMAGISSVLTMVIIILFGINYKSNLGQSSLGVYSFITFAVIFVTGGIAGVSTAKNTKFGGLFERLTIGAFMQWILVVALSFAK